MKADFTIYRYQNGNLATMTSSADTYPTRERALAAAHAMADYWFAIFKMNYRGCELQTNNEGAILWFTDNEGNRCRNEYKVYTWNNI